MEVRGEALATPMLEPQGVARDPLSGNVLVVDDNEGLNAIFEFAPDMTLLSVTPLSDYGWDAEGIAVHAQTGTLYVGFDSGQRIAVFDYLPTRDGGGSPFAQGPDCPMS
jgi:DNA-binding beta-propeller fold protein YncE